MAGLSVDDLGLEKRRRDRDIGSSAYDNGVGIMPTPRCIPM